MHTKPEMIRIFDTTLRDGEQSPGCSMNAPEKLQLARQLARLGVDIIEAGFPVASPGDFESVQAIARGVEGVVVAGLSRARAQDIARCYEAIRDAAKPRIHTFIATSDIHMTHKLNMTPKQVIEAISAAVSHARSLCEDVEFSAEDATRSRPEFLAEAFSAAVAAGATTLNVPDTVGYTIPSEFTQLISYLKKNIQNVDRAVISVHCHNDLGLAVANSLAAVEAGARQVECTINGIGERAGNASLEELVMTLVVRQDTLPFLTRIDTAQIYPASKLLSHITGVRVQPNKAIVGDNAFAHEAGIHQDGVLKSQLTYEIMTPESVGIPRNRLVLGKHSGRHAFQDRLADLGVSISQAEVERAFSAFKRLADRKKTVYDEDILALVEPEFSDREARYSLESLAVTSRNADSAKAELALLVDGVRKEAVETSPSGPIDAAFKAIKKLSGFSGELTQFKINAVTGGTDAQGEVLVAVSDGKRHSRGIVSDTDIVVAAVRAFLEALNRLAVSREVPTEGV